MDNAAVSDVNTLSPQAENSATPEVIVEVTTGDGLIEDSARVQDKSDPVVTPSDTSVLDSTVLLSPDAPEQEVTQEPSGDEVSQSEEAPLPTYELVIPEGVELSDNDRSEFTSMIGQYEQLITKDPSKVREATQGLIQSLFDRHIAEMKKVHDYYGTAQESKAAEWQESFKNDPELGGERMKETLQSARSFIKTYGGTETQQAELYKMLQETKVGNHPTLIRLLANAMRSNPSPQPLPGTKPMSQPQNKIQKRYGGSR